MRVYGLSFVAAALVSACQIEAPELSTTEQLAVVASPSQVTFPSTQVGQTSAPMGITVRPSGFLVETFDQVNSVTENCADFVISAPGLPAPVRRECVQYDNCDNPPCPIPAVQNCLEWEVVDYTFTASFQPNIGATVSCAVHIDMQQDTTKTVTLSGTGTLPPVDVNVQPASVNFGDVRRTTASTAATITVRNLGGQTMQVSSVSVGSGFAITSGTTGAYTVPAGGSRAYAVTCNPTTTGTLSGQFRVNSNDPSTPTVNVALTCRGIDSNLDISPSPATIPTTRVGEPVDRAIDLINSGTASMMIESVVLDSSGLTMVEAPPAGTVLAAGGSATARIAFDAASSGDVTGSLIVTYDGGQSRSAEISARALATSMALTPDGTVDFGPVCIGHQQDQMFTIVANEQGAFSVDEVSAPGEPFTVKGLTLPAAVQGAGANEVAFVVTAAPVAEGPATATLTVSTDIPGAMPRDINLVVDGLTAGVAATPAILDFGSHELETTTIGQPVTVTNCGTEPATLSNPRIEGTDAGDFALVTQPPSLEVAPTAQVSWLVVATVHAVGIRTATFVVDSPDGPRTIELGVEGLGDDIGTGPGGPGRPSYYKCSTGGPGGAWPLALALAALLVRRRRRGSRRAVRDSTRATGR